MPWTLLESGMTALRFCLWLIAYSLGGGVSFAAFAQDTRMQQACEQFASRPFAEVKIVASQAVSSGQIVNLNQPITYVGQSFCRVEGFIDADIGFELWLPAPEQWNQRLLTGGVGGQAGSFNYQIAHRGVQRGYATATTDSGHKVADVHWLLMKGRQAENYAERAHHLLAVKAKEMMQAYYGTFPKHAFFIGCSGGGRQALTEVQRYPIDYDGVIAGAPGVNTPEMSARRLWEMKQHSEWGSLMTQKHWDWVAKEARKQCDASDGVINGLTENPRQCRFNVSSLVCTAQRTEACLTPSQIAAVEKIHAPLTDEVGVPIDGGLPYGVRITADPLPEPFTPGPRYLAVVLFSEGIYRDPNWDISKFNISRDLKLIDQVMNLHADDPNLDLFRDAGGKLILYHGWTDQLVSPYSTLAYQESLLVRYGSQALDHFSRLYMVPGMDHCRGGEGADQFGGMGNDGPVVDSNNDMLTALEHWVLRGESPRDLIASRIANGNVERTHRLCTYPKTAKYIGFGSPLVHTNYRCE